MNPPKTINGERIRQGREIAGLTQDQLAKATGLNQSHIALFEQNFRQPKDETVKAIALATGFPVAFFRSDSAPEFPMGSLLYRRKKAMTSRDRDRVRQTGRLVFEAIQTMAERFKRIELRLPRIPNSEPEEAARITRADLGLSPDLPITNLITRLEKHGVVVAVVPYHIQEYDAFSVWAETEPRTPVIVMATSVPGDRQRWSISHELGHLVLHFTYAATPAQLEEEANRFSAEFLLPEEAIRKDLCPPLTLTILADLKSRWGVSMQSLINRAFQLDVISDGQRRYLYRQMATKGWVECEPVPIPAEKPRLLRKLAETIYGQTFDSKAVADLLNAPNHLLKPIVNAYASATEMRTGKLGRIEDIEKQGGILRMPRRKTSEGV